MYSIKKILVPTDFSDNASSAYHSAQQLAQKYGATVDFIHIIPSHGYFTRSMADLEISLSTSQNLYSRLQDKTNGKLQKLMDKYIKQENKGTCYAEVAEKPSKAIAEKAMSDGYDMIVMAAKGQHATDFWAGSTTKRVMRYSKVPVFSTRKNGIEVLQNILVPTDGSPESLQALPPAISIAAAFKAKITMYNVIVLQNAWAEEVFDSNSESIYRKIREELFTEMETFFEKSWDNISVQKNKEDEGQLIFRQNPSEVVIDLKIIVQRDISKYDAITEYAQDEADIMIMATHGRRGISHLLFGSVAEDVAQKLKFPVITVQMDFDEAN